MPRAIPWLVATVAVLAGSAVAVAQNATAPAAQPPAAQAPAAQAPVPPPPAAPATAPTAPSAAPGPIAALQQELKEAGYDPGPINGVMTGKTRQAMAAFQRRGGHHTAAGDADPVKRVQARLQGMGLFAGPADGALGPQTRDAIIRFEAARHLPIDPRVSDQLLAALDEAGGNQGNTAPPPTQPNAGPAGPPSSATPEALGRRALPSWVNPPPIR